MAQRRRSIKRPGWMFALTLMVSCSRLLSPGADPGDDAGARVRCSAPLVALARRVDLCRTGWRLPGKIRIHPGLYGLLLRMHSGRYLSTASHSAAGIMDALVGTRCELLDGSDSRVRSRPRLPESKYRRGTVFPCQGWHTNDSISNARTRCAGRGKFKTLQHAAVSRVTGRFVAVFSRSQRTVSCTARRRQ